MTDDVRNDVAAELKLADDCLSAVEHLMAARLPSQAAGRLYYAAFHAARALLFSIGVATRNAAMSSARQQRRQRGSDGSSLATSA